MCLLGKNKDLPEAKMGRVDSVIVLLQTVARKNDKTDLGSSPAEMVDIYPSIKKAVNSITGIA